MQNRTRKSAALAVALALGAGLGLAQPEAEDPNEVVDSEDAAETVAPAIPDTPLEDYEASEQISEDLSVSFPIDI